MKKYLLLSMVFFSVGAFGLKCPDCLKEKHKSEVIPSNCVRKLMDCDAGRWDEDGKFLMGKDCNQTVCDFKCTHGHKFHGSVEEIEAKQNPAPAK